MDNEISLVYNSSFQFTIDQKVRINVCVCVCMTTPVCQDLKHIMTTGLREPFHFPAFTALPDYDSPWGPYYKEVGSRLVKTVHWCFLADINEVANFIRPRVRVRTASGAEIIVHFHHERHEQPTTFQWTDMQPGRCIALQYVYRKQMMDFSEGTMECLSSARRLRSYYWYLTH